jgi:hypothetical protein
MCGGVVCLLSQIDQISDRRSAGAKPPDPLRWSKKCGDDARSHQLPASRSDPEVSASSTILPMRIVRIAARLPRPVAEAQQRRCHVTSANSILAPFEMVPHLQRTYQWHPIWNEGSRSKAYWNSDAVIMTITPRSG